MSDLPPKSEEQDVLNGLAASFHKRTRFVATVFAGIGFLNGIVFSIFVLAPPGWNLRQWIVVLSMPPGTAAMFAGAAYAASAFFAPTGYFETKQGAELLAILQTRSVGFARIIAAVLISLCLVTCFVTLSYVATWMDWVRVRG